MGGRSFDGLVEDLCREFCRKRMGGPGTVTGAAATSDGLPAIQTGEEKLPAVTLWRRVAFRSRADWWYSNPEFTRARTAVQKVVPSWLGTVKLCTGC